MDWQPTLEMAGSSIASGVLLILGYWLGIISQAALLPSVCTVACLAMLAVMLRIPLYSSSHAGHGRGDPGCSVTQIGEGVLVRVHRALRSMATISEGLPRRSAIASPALSGRGDPRPRRSLRR